MATNPLRGPSQRHERLDENWLHLFALDQLVNAIRSEGAYESHGYAGLTLIKNDHMRVVLEAARGGSRIARHRFEGPSFVQVLEGSIRIVAGDETRVVHAGEMAVTPRDRLREMECEDDSAFLWVLAVD